MRAFIYSLLASAAALMLALAPGDATAQNDQTNGPQRQGAGRQRPGNFDPAQFQKRMMDRYRERLEITDDTEWKAMEPLIQKVLDARTAAGTGGRGGFTRGGRRGGDASAAGPSQTRTPLPSNPAAEELQKAIDTKAPAAEVKAALAKYAEYRKSKRAELESAQEALRAVLTSRQEAIAVMSGLL
jgi:hypothetical protein